MLQRSEIDNKRKKERKMRITAYQHAVMEAHSRHTENGLSGEECASQQFTHFAQGFVCRGFTSRKSSKILHSHSTGHFIGQAVVSRLHSHDRTDRHDCGLIIISAFVCGHEKGECGST